MATHIPFPELLKSIPGTFGIRLEEEPRFQVVDALPEDVEIRRYAPTLLAEITIPGPHDDALDEAFDRLARYIFGGNSRRETLPMTIPVYQGRGASLAMTTPVSPRADGAGWTVAFFLANDKRPAEVPQPEDPAIRLIEQPERTIAALRYSGNNTEERRIRARETLLRVLEGSNWQVDSRAWWAQYDAPFVLPFLKRNEAMVAVGPPGTFM